MRFTSPKPTGGAAFPRFFTHDEATRLLAEMAGSHKLLASLMYGSGLRVMEAVRLRVQDVDFAQSCIFTGLERSEILCHEMTVSNGASKVAECSGSLQRPVRQTRYDQSADLP